MFVPEANLSIWPFTSLAFSARAPLYLDFRAEARLVTMAKPGGSQMATYGCGPSAVAAQPHPSVGDFI